MPLETRARVLLVANAVLSWALALPGLVDPLATGIFLGGEEPYYGYFVRLAAGLTFLFGLISWEASRDVRGGVALLKYLWLGKTVTAIVVTVGHLGGEALPRTMLLNLLANILWIPPLAYVDFALRRAAPARETFDARLGA
jgi:hypothetical protein